MQAPILQEIDRILEEYTERLNDAIYSIPTDNEEEDESYHDMQGYVEDDQRDRT